jgi:hypothetical protein
VPSRILWAAAKTAIEGRIGVAMNMRFQMLSRAEHRTAQARSPVVEGAGDPSVAVTRPVNA